MPSGRHCSRGSPVASADGRFVAWVTIRCPESEDRSVGAVHRARTDGTDEQVDPVGSAQVSVVGFLGRRVVYNRGFRDGAWITDFRGPPSRISGVERVTDVTEGRGWLIGERAGERPAVITVDGTVRWRHHDAGNLVAFNPSGTQVLAVHERQISTLDAENGSTTSRIGLPAASTRMPPSGRATAPS